MGGDISAPDVHAKTLAEWKADCIICGLAALDAEHIALLGYVPADTSVPTSVPGDNESAIEDDWPELQIVLRTTGEVLSVDALPLRGPSPADLPISSAMAGPRGYRLLSDQSSQMRRGQHRLWSLKHVLQRAARGGLRGVSPTLLVSSLSDIVIVRVKDTDDRISEALDSEDLKEALELAISDRLSLRRYRLQDICLAYIHKLLESGQAEKAATECPRVLGTDTTLWELVLNDFISHRQLSCLAPYLPSGGEYRLNNESYEVSCLRHVRA